MLNGRGNQAYRAWEQPRDGNELDDVSSRVQAPRGAPTPRVSSVPFAVRPSPHFFIACPPPTQKLCHRRLLRCLPLLPSCIRHTVTQANINFPSPPEHLLHLHSPRLLSLFISRIAYLWVSARSWRCACIVNQPLHLCAGHCAVCVLGSCPGVMLCCEYRLCVRIYGCACSRQTFFSRHAPVIVCVCAPLAPAGNARCRPRCAGCAILCAGCQSHRAQRWHGGPPHPLVQRRVLLVRHPRLCAQQHRLSHGQLVGVGVP